MQFTEAWLPKKPYNSLTTSNRRRSFGDTSALKDTHASSSFYLLTKQQPHTFPRWRKF